MRPLTAKQSSIVAFIRECIAGGAPPTHAELCEHFGWSSRNSAQTHLTALKQKGAIQIRPNSSRGVRLHTCSEVAVKAE